MVTVRADRCETGPVTHQHPHPPEHGHTHRQPQPVEVTSRPPVPMADASVRTGRASDAPAVGLVQATVWRDMYADVVPPEVLEEFDPDRFGTLWRKSLTEPPTPLHRLLVGCAGDQVVGFAAIGPADAQEPGIPEDAGELLVLAVHPDARRVGHGSRLLNAAADTLRANDRSSLLTWLPATDEQARQFAEQSGLHPDGAWRERVVGPDGQTAREIRVQAEL